MTNEEPEEVTPEELIAKKKKRKSYRFTGKVEFEAEDNIKKKIALKDELASKTIFFFKQTNR